jgi:hypothetical protein
VQISLNRHGNPEFHLEINGKMYFYRFREVTEDFKIILTCLKKYKRGKGCYISSTLEPSNCLKQIIQNLP